MSSRFERIIVVGIAAGALTLAGCGSSGGGGDGDGNGNTEPSTVEFLGGHTISTTEIELQFSGPVTVGDATTAAALFAISGNQLNFGVHTFDTMSGAALTGKNVIATDTFQPDGTVYASAYYSFTSPSDLGDVETVEADGDVVTLTLSASIPFSADHDTGTLRLSYTGDTDGLVDGDGNALPDITLGVTDNGNIADTLADGAQGPILIGARTIDATHVELLFNKPVVVANEANALDSFSLTSNNGLNLVASAIGFFPHASSEYGADWLAQNSGFSWDFSSVTGSLYLGYEVSSSPESVEGIEVSGERPERLIITLGGPIPASADGGTGRLRLYYNQSGITDADTNPMDQLGFGQLHRGNVEDTID